MHDTVRDRLIIVGAGDFGREVLAWAEAVPAAQRNWEIGGFLDDRPDAGERLQAYGVSEPVLGSSREYVPQQHDVFIPGIGNPAAKLAICTRLMERGARFINIVHPTAVIAPRVQLGVGNVICPYTVLAVDARLGNFVAVNLHSSIGHDAVLEDGVTVSCHVDITGHALIGRGVLLGSHASVLPKSKVGAAAVVGAGSVVVRFVKAGTTVLGVPAKVIIDPSK